MSRSRSWSSRSRPALPKGVRAGLEAEAADVGRFLGAEAKLRVERP